MPTRARWHRGWPRLLAYAAVAVLLAYALFPVLWMVSTAVKPADEIRTANPTFVPTRFTGEHFALVVWESNFLIYVRNSLLVATTVTAATLVVSSSGRLRLQSVSAAARYNRGRLWHDRGQLVPGVLLVVPLYITMKNLGLLDSLWSLILTYTTFSVPLSTLMLKGFFDQVPAEVEEAAELDGCPSWQVVWRIALPLAIPGLMTTALYAFVQSWNEFLFGYTFISQDERRTLTPGLADFIGIWTVDWGALMAAASLAVLPVTVAYLYLQRYLISGIATGATKG